MTDTQDKEVHVSLNDQKKINQFARLNNRHEELKEESKIRSEEKQKLEDASTDLMMLEDDDEKVPYQIGEIFLLLSQDDAQSEIEKRKDILEKEVKEIDVKMQEIKNQMSDLKTQLYAKFGSSINLEADE